ncbi:MAG: DUF5985 family protein [Burkholderiaceae bacterium]
MIIFIYMLCIATSIVCSVLLVRGYAKSRNRLLFWSSLYFIGATINNTLLLLDKTIFLTSADLLTWRLLAGLGASLILLFGLIWEGR